MGQFPKHFHYENYQFDEDTEDTEDTGTSYSVLWKCKEDYGEETFQIKLTIYQMDFLQVTTALMYFDTNFFLVGQGSQLHNVDAGLFFRAEEISPRIE